MYASSEFNATGVQSLYSLYVFSIVVGVGGVAIAVANVHKVTKNCKGYIGTSKGLGLQLTERFLEGFASSYPRFNVVV